MSIFPTRILLATDGSEDATLAAQTAIDLANKTGSELHVVYAGISSYSPALYEGYEEGVDRTSRRRQLEPFVTSYSTLR